MNKKIIVQKRIKAKNCLSNETWEDDYTLWAEILDEKISVDKEKEGTMPSKTISFKVRKSSKTSSLCTLENKIKYKGEVFKIEEISNFKYNKNFLKLECRQVK